MIFSKAIKVVGKLSGSYQEKNSAREIPQARRNDDLILQAKSVFIKVRHKRHSIHELRDELRMGFPEKQFEISEHNCHSLTLL
jgi:hypothetical protein